MLSPITGTRSPNIHHRDPDSGVYQNAAQADVSEVRLSHLSDEELEAHIRDLGQLSLEAYAAYTAFGCADDRAEAIRWGEMRDAAVRARSAAQVARMERERGLE